MNHYSADVVVVDAIMNDRNSTIKSPTDIAVLADSEVDAKALITEFFSRSGVAFKTVNGVNTIYRSTYSNRPGAIRSVVVSNLTLVPEQVPVVEAVPAVTPKTRTSRRAAPPVQETRVEHETLNLTTGKEAAEVVEEKKEEPAAAAAAAEATETKATA
jgi:hypothetical protein